MKTLEGQSGEKTAQRSEGRTPHPPYLLVITVVTIQLVQVRRTL